MHQTDTNTVRNKSGNETQSEAQNPAPETGRSPASRKKRRRIIFISLLAVLAAAAGITAANFSKIKNALLLRFAGPEGYMAYVETNYLLSQGKAWKAQKQALSEAFSGQELSGVRADIRVNQLLTGLLQAQGAAPEGAKLSGLSLLLLTADKEERSLFQLAAQIDEKKLVSLDFLSDHENELLYIACPQAASSALALTTAKNDPAVALLQYLDRLFRSFFTSVYTAVSADPYEYLLPYLDVVTDVTLEHDVPLPAAGTEQTAIRLNMTLSLDTALETAAVQLAEIKAQPDMADPLLSCYELAIRLLEYVSERYPASLRIAAYVDARGNVLGHEFFLVAPAQAASSSVQASAHLPQTASSSAQTSSQTTQAASSAAQTSSQTAQVSSPQEQTLLSLTGILTPDAGFGKSGELTLTFALSDEPIVFQLSVSQAGSDPVTGLPSGKINFSCSRLSALHFQLLLSETDNMPKLRLYIRALGATAASLDIAPSSQKPEPFPSPQDYTEAYSLAGLSAFVQSLDFSGIISDFYNETGIDIPALRNLLSPALH